MPSPTNGSFTQEDLNRIATREKAEGERAATARFAAELGVPIEDAKRIIANAKAAEDSQKSEAQLAREAADAEKAAAATEKAAAAREIHEARIDRAFIASGVTDPAKIARFGRMLEVEPGATPDEIKEAVDKIKTEMPELFTPVTPPPPVKKAPPGDPKGTPPSVKVNEDAYERGLRLAQERGNQGNAYPART